MTTIFAGNITLLESSQQYKELLINQGIRVLSVFEKGVVSNSVTTPPSGPVADDYYLVPSGSSGAWSGQAGKIAIPNLDSTNAVISGSWTFITPPSGGSVYVASAGADYFYNGSAWIAKTTGVFAYSVLSAGASYTLTPSDANTYLVVPRQTTTTLTIPASGFSTGNTLKIFSGGTGSNNITLAAGGGATINTANGVAYLAPNQEAQLTFMGGSSWALTFGNAGLINLTEDTSPDSANDFIRTYDASAGSEKKVKLTNLTAGLSATDQYVKNTSSDTTADYLNNKIVVGTNLAKATVNPGGNEQLEIGLGANVTTQGNTFNGANNLVKLDSLGRLPAIDGSQLTGISSGGSGGWSAWTSFTPSTTWTSGVTWTGRYRTNGKERQVYYRGDLTGPPTNTGLQLTIPNGETLDNNFSSDNGIMLGQTFFLDNGTASLPGVVLRYSSTQLWAIYQSVSGSLVTLGGVTATAPFAWNILDKIELFGSYFVN